VGDATALDRRDWTCRKRSVGRRWGFRSGTPGTSASSDPRGSLRDRAINALIGTTTKKKTAAAMVTNVNTLLMKSRTEGAVVDGEVQCEKSCSPTIAAISGVRKVLYQRCDHGAECDTDHDRDRQVDDIPLSKNCRKSLRISSLSSIPKSRANLGIIGPLASRCKSYRLTLFQTLTQAAKLACGLLLHGSRPQSAPRLCSVRSPYRPKPRGLRAIVGEEALAELHSLPASAGPARAAPQRCRLRTAVSDTLSSLVPLMTDLGLPSQWQVLRPAHEFMAVNKACTMPWPALAPAGTRTWRRSGTSTPR